MGRRALYQPIYNPAPAFRLLAHLSHEELCKKLGCSRSHLYRLQAGQRQPSRVMAERLAGLARLDVKDLTVRIDGPADGEETAQESLGGREDGRV